MFPIRDHNPSGAIPYVTYALMVANVAVFLAYWTTLSGDRQLNAFFYSWGLVPSSLLGGEGLLTPLSSMFLHGGWMHLIGNMWFLWIFGDNLEEEFGHRRFLIFYLLSGLAAAALQIGADPVSQIPMVGASGAIAGVMGGYLLLFPKARIDVLFIIVIFFRIVPIPAWIVLGVWIGLQFFNGASTPTDAGGVAYWAHVGGFVGGFVLTIPALLRRGGVGYWQRTHGHPPHPETVYPARKSSIPRLPRR